MAARERGNKRKVVVKIADYGTEVTYCPPDVGCEVFDHHNAGEEGHPSPEEMEKLADGEKARAGGLRGLGDTEGRHRKLGEGSVMDYMKHTLMIEGAGPEEAAEIASVLAERGLAGREGAFDRYAFDADYEAGADGVYFGNAGETEDNPNDVLRGLSALYPHTLFVWDTVGHEEDCGRTYFRDGRSHDAERIVSYTPFDEAKLR